MLDTGSASGESSQPSEGKDYPMRRRNESAPDEGGLTDSISLILKRLRLMKKEMAPNKTEFEEKLVIITQNTRSAADKDTASSVKTASKETIECMDGRATEAQKKSGMPETGGNGDSPGGNGDEDFHFQMAAETIQERVEVGGSRQHFATLRPEAPNMFTGKPVELGDWLEAVHIYLALYGQTDYRIMYMVVCQFLSADVRTWVKNPTYRLLDKLAEGNAGVLCGSIGGGPRMKLPQ
jgi:hypothetical protein